MKRTSNGRQDIRRIIIFLSIIFVVAIIDYRVFLAKSREIVLYDDFNGHLGFVRVSTTKLEYLLDMFVVAGRFEKTTVDIIKDDVDKLDTEISSGLLNTKYEEVLRGNVMLSDGISSIADDWQTIKIEIRRLNSASSPDEVRLIHDAVDMHTVSLIDKSEKLLSVTADGRNRIFYSAMTQALFSVIGFILVSLIATLYVYNRYILRIKKMVGLTRGAASNERLVMFDEHGGYIGALGAALNAMNDAAQKAIYEKNAFIEKQAADVEQRVNQIYSLDQILELAGRSLSQSDMIDSVVREAVAAGGADASAMYMNEDGLKLKGASGLHDTIFKEGASLVYPELNSVNIEAVRRLYVKLEDFPDKAYGQLMSGLGFAAIAVCPVRFNNLSLGLLLIAYKDAAVAIAASAPFFESLSASLGVSVGYIGLYQQESRSKRFFERIVSQFPYGVAVFERDGTCRLCNDSFRAIMGFGPVCEYRLFDDTILMANGVLDLFKRTFEGYPGQAVVDYDPSELFVKFGFTGHSAPLRLSSYPLYGMDGEISNIVVVYENIISNKIVDMNSGLEKR